MFYDPVKKTTQPWVLPAFIIIGLITVIVLFQIGKKHAEKTGADQEAVEVDIFQR